VGSNRAAEACTVCPCPLTEPESASECPVIHCGYPYTVYEDSQWISLQVHTATAFGVHAAAQSDLIAFCKATEHAM
jgi:hypothetical protein